MIEPCLETDMERVLSFLEERFGLSRGLFQSWEFYSGSKGRVILGPKKVDHTLQPDTAGLLIARIAQTVKPSSNLLQLFGKSVTRNIVVLSKEQTRLFVMGQDLKITEDEMKDAGNGYVLLKYLDAPLGCGLLKDLHIKNMLPKAKRVNLKYW